ncbi:MAG: hypothetical protein GY707_11470 [Desulfobacteraceae bacterium]|nr:hypothetical protein [Desulfobacteraceae bacterium]
MVELNNFISEWEDTESKTKQAFTEILEHLQKTENITLDFNARPGITFSLRPKHNNQKDRALFAMIDVIDDDPEEKWLSICFYGDMISDPDEMGDIIPDGLLGDDGHCFDMYEYNTEEIEYLKNRLDDAYKSAQKSS